MIPDNYSPSLRLHSKDVPTTISFVRACLTAFDTALAGAAAASCTASASPGTFFAVSAFTLSTQVGVPKHEPCWVGHSSP